MKLTNKQLKQILVGEKKATRIIAELQNYGIICSEREWRAFVRKFNDDYANKELYIASSRNGYQLTTKKSIISHSAICKFRTGLAMMKNAKATLKELSDKNQLSLLEQDADIYDLVMKMKV